MNAERLSESELRRCKPVRGEGGRALRAFCPFHGGDKQRSLRVNLQTGNFKCFACNVWGYLEDSRPTNHDYSLQSLLQRKYFPQTTPHQPTRHQTTRNQTEPRPKAAVGIPRNIEDLTPTLTTYQQALPNSLGAEYLHRRGIPLEVAQANGVGYAAPRTWIHKARDWKWGRLIFPHHSTAGTLVNLYGRAVGADEKVPKPVRHDHLPGEKGCFLAGQSAPVSTLAICEGVFDALSLHLAGFPRAVAIFGVQGWDWRWIRDVNTIVLALDADQAGQDNWRLLARQAKLRGKQVEVLDPAAYGGQKDANAAWIAGLLTI